MVDRIEVSVASMVVVDNRMMRMVLQQVKHRMAAVDMDTVAAFGLELVDQMVVRTSPVVVEHEVEHRCHFVEMRIADVDDESALEVD